MAYHSHGLKVLYPLLEKMLRECAPRIATSSFPYNFTPIQKDSCYLVVLNGLCEYLNFQENEKEKKLETVTKESPLKAHHKVYLQDSANLTAI